MRPYLNKYKKKEPLTIVCIGDSTTSQEWCHPNWVDWINFVFRQGEGELEGVKRKVINSGGDGQNNRYFIENFEDTIAMYKPDIVVMSLGFNHLEKIDRFSESTLELVKMIKEIGSEVVLWSTYDTPNLKYSEKLGHASNIYQEVAKSQDAIFVDIYSEFRRYNLPSLFTFVHQWDNPDWGLKPGDIDFIHCNKIGNQVIAEKILKEVFETDLSMTKEWEAVGGRMGNMFPVDLNNYLLEKHNGE
ncbi:SGNH/GDSL hydrolase family protein [Candidatus Dojkabacteria bacterium]|nr:SGNH/GDSL hydrolase family protein [Candidatus Dojkabacteria bacterium]